MKKRFGLAAVVSAALLVARARRDWFPVRVEGLSMLPTLKPGDVLAVRPPRRDEPHAGQLVVVRRGDMEIVKRVAETMEGDALGADEIWLTGDNPDASTDSRATGPAARQDVVGVVRARYRPIRSLRAF